jgi:type IX secretion system PorP/SprF family membrane protein
MKNFLLAGMVLAGCTAWSQMQTTYNQYMLNTNMINPAYIDLDARFGANVSGRKAWTTGEGTPLSIAANGYYRLDDAHSVGMIASNDRIANTSTTEVGFSYTYDLRIARRLWLGLGAKASFQQRGVGDDYTYFGPGVDPVLEKPGQIGFTAGAGFTLQNKNFTFGASLPFMLNNSLGNRNQFTLYDNHAYSHISYKMRASDDFIFIPSALMKAVKGSKVNLSFDGHFLIKQVVWVGGGYRSDNTVGGSVGIFLPKGLRIVYSYETATWSAHKSLTNTHEVTLNYAQSLETLPFQRRLHRKRSGKLYRNPDPSWRDY